MKSSAAGISLRASARTPGYWSELLLGRALPACFFSLFLLDKLVFAAASADAMLHSGFNATFATCMFTLNQVLALVYYTLLVVLFATRRSRAGGRRSPITVVVAFFGTFSILIIGVLPGYSPRLELLAISSVLLAAGLCYSLWSLLYLGRSLSILPEARHLVTGGPYGVTRHPLYLGEAIAGIGAAVPTIGVLGFALIFLFLSAQYVRAGWEEQVLARYFPVEYATYRRRVPKFVPDPRRLFAGN